MKLISKTKAWDIEIDEKGNRGIYLYGKSIQVSDFAAVKTESMIKTSHEYYSSIIIVKSKNLLIAMGNCSCALDIYSFPRIELICSVKWNGDKQFIREKILLDQKEEKIYCILYSEELTKTVVTSIDLFSFEEKIEKTMRNAYLFTMGYSVSRNDYLLLGACFDSQVCFWKKTEQYQGIWLNTGKTLMIPKINFHNKTLENVGIMGDGIILYYATGIYDCAKSKYLVKEIQGAAFSKSGRYYAYVKRQKKRMKLYVVLYGTQEIIDSIEIIRGENSLIYSFEFCNSDKYLYLRFVDDMYLFRITDICME